MRRGIAATALALSALAAGTIGGGTPAPAGAQGGSDGRPNVVVIQADDQSTEMMRVMTKTNRLLGDRGATFPNNFTNWPLCCPSRATQLTGQYAHNHGVLGNRPPEGGYDVFPREDNLAVWLDAEGYRVGHVGKFLNGYGPRNDDPATPYNDVTEVPPGWTDWRTGTDGTTYSFYGYTQNEFTAAGETDRDGDLVAYNGAVADFKTDVNTQDATELISEYAGGSDPFYLQVDYLAPHGGGPNEDMPQPPFDCGQSAKPAPRHAAAFDDEPLAPAEDPAFNEADVSDKPPFIQRTDPISDEDYQQILGRYRCRLESTLAIDEGVAAIVDELKAAGEMDNTYIFYTSDNGFFHGEHRIKAGKTRVYEPSINVPLLVRGPGIPKGVEVSDLTSNADFATTIYEITGAEPSAARPPDGRSLIGATRKPWRETGRELLIETDNYTAVRTQSLKLVEHEDGFVELYDLEADPSELSNVAADPAYADPLSRLTARLAALRTCAGESCRLKPALDVSYRREGDGRGCVDGAIEVKLEGDDVEEIESAEFFLRGKSVRVDDGAPFRVRLRRQELKQRSRALVETSTELRDGRRVTTQRDFDICR